MEESEHIYRTQGWCQIDKGEKKKKKQDWSVKMKGQNKEHKDRMYFKNERFPYPLPMERDRTRNKDAKKFW